MSTPPGPLCQRNSLSLCARMSDGTEGSPAGAGLLLSPVPASGVAAVGRTPPPPPPPPSDSALAATAEVGVRAAEACTPPPPTPPPNRRRRGWKAAGMMPPPPPKPPPLEAGRLIAAPFEASVSCLGALRCFSPAPAGRAPSSDPRTMPPREAELAELLLNALLAPCRAQQLLFLNLVDLTDDAVQHALGHLQRGDQIRR